MTEDRKGRTMIGTRAPVGPPRLHRPETQQPVPGAGGTGVQSGAAHTGGAPARSPTGPGTPQPGTGGAPAPYSTGPGLPQPHAPAVPPGGGAPTPYPAGPGGPPTPSPANPGFATHAPTMGPAPGPSPWTGAGAFAPLPPERDPFVGQSLGGYLVKRKLAEGGMGVVYEGQNQIGRTAAIKVLKLEFCRAEDVVERFYQEARAVNAIRHENIVDIFDFGRDPQGRVFFVMEYLEGEALSGRIRRGALPWAEAFPILDQVLRALKAAHEKGFVHRDLKPDNIWLRYVDGRAQVKLLDFGIAKLVGSESPREKLTQTGSVIGTPHYMSPEQISGARDLDHRTDVYAMGVIMYEMFAGVTPFLGDTLAAVMTGHLFHEAPKLAQLPPDLGVPPPLAEIIDRALVKDAAGRYDGVGQVLEDLHAIHRHQRPSNADTLTRTRPPPPAGTYPAVAGLAAPPSGGFGPQVPIGPPIIPGAVSRGPGKRALIIGGVLAVAGVAAASFVLGSSKPGSQAAGPNVVATNREGSAAGSAGEPRPEPPPPLDYDQLRKDAQVLLRASLHEAEPGVRAGGADALARILDRASIETLTELTKADPDLEVRGHTGEALGLLGARDAAPQLRELEKAAPPPLKVWYASALARLGDASARKRLYDYARDKDLAVAFKAGLALAEVSPAGDKKALKALSGLAQREKELNQRVRYAGAVILAKMAGLRDAQARQVLYGLLDNGDEGVQLAAAGQLARLGDEAGKPVLARVAANRDAEEASRLNAAMSQLWLGEYGGADLFAEKLADKDPDVRVLAARALGKIGARDSVPSLLALTKDPVWTVRLEAAEAIVGIVGLDAQVLANVSVDWTAKALKSDDLATRRAAAGVLSDLPEDAAMPLLAQAITDGDRAVRLTASKSAGKMKTAEAAKKVAAAAMTETDPQVKEQQVAALGEIGRAEAREALTKIAEEPGRIGVLAAGSLIATGEVSASEKLEAAVTASSKELRLAAVEAASAAKNPIVVPTLVKGIDDRVPAVQFAAAEGLSIYKAQKALAVPILTKALESRDATVMGRAMAALARLGETPASKQSPKELVDSADPAQRLAALAALVELPSAEAVPLLRRLVADPNQEVRRAAVDAIEVIAAKDKDAAIRLYKPLVRDADDVVRAKASGQLARLTPTVVVGGGGGGDDDGTTAAIDATLPKVQQALDDAKRAAADSEAAVASLQELTAELTKLAGAAGGADASARLAELSSKLAAPTATAEDATRRLAAATAAATAAAGAKPTPEAARLLEDAQQLQATTASAVDAGRTAATAALAQAEQAAQEAQRPIRHSFTCEPECEVFLGKDSLGMAKEDVALDLDFRPEPGKTRTYTLKPVENATLFRAATVRADAGAPFEKTVKLPCAKRQTATRPNGPILISTDDCKGK